MLFVEDTKKPIFNSLKDLKDNHSINEWFNLSILYTMNPPFLNQLKNSNPCLMQSLTLISLIHLLPSSISNPSILNPLLVMLRISNGSEDSSTPQNNPKNVIPSPFQLSLIFPSLNTQLLKTLTSRLPAPSSKRLLIQGLLLIQHLKNLPSDASVIRFPLLHARNSVCCGFTKIFTDY